MSARNVSPSGWVGWVYFAGFMMMILGGLQIIDGLAGIFRGSYFLVTANHLLLFNFQTWGWINLVMGIIILAAGYELFRGAMWARVLALFLAALSIIANMAYMDAYPLWSIMMIAIDVLIIYALIVHGDEAASVM